MTKIKIIKYIGEGSYIDGIPARDLSPADWERHKDLILLCPTAHELYEIPENSLPVAKPEGAMPVSELAGVANG